MTTTAKSLLDIMSIRLSMHEAGVTRPQPSVALATRTLVERLQLLEPEEGVKISYELKPFHAQYIRLRTGEVIAEIVDDEPSIN